MLVIEGKTSQEVFEMVNKELGYAIEVMGRKKGLVGRHDELRELSVIMERRDTPVALLLAPAGAGKTALVGEWSNRRENMTGKKVVMLELKVGMLASEGADILITRMNTMMEKLKLYQDALQREDPRYEVILFIDEVHTVITVFGTGTKIGGDLLKTALGRAEEYIKVIAATTNDEYNRYIASDKPLARRFKTLSLLELNSKETFEVLRGWLKSKSSGNEDLNEVVSDEVLRFIIESNRQYRPDFHEPAKSIDTIATMESMHRVDNVPFDKNLVIRAFKTQYDVRLDFSVDAERIYNMAKERIKGQPLALFTVRKLIQRLSFRLDDTTQRPLATAMFAGTTGTGKSELTKILAEGVYGDTGALINISMTDYSTPDADERFRRVIGQAVSQRPSAVILLDELEKASKEVLAVLLPILDEGLVTYVGKGADGYETEFKASLKNTIIIATSNAGADAFNELHKYANVEMHGEELTKEMEENARIVEASIIEALGSSNLKPEFLQRFSVIVPFSTLSEKTLTEIAQMMLISLLRQIKDVKGYEIRIPPNKRWADYPDVFIDEISMFVVFERMNTENANESGARRIRSIIQRDVLGAILDAIYENPHHTKFNLMTDGKARFQNPDDASPRGSIIVKPMG